MNYRQIEKKELKDLQSTGYIYEHIKTKARICFIVNEDTNKAFSVNFRTPPQDSTGLTHILEHSVLCGSRKYPVKDPFIELAKGSLNTFLNAMTFSDKTMYPLASVNDQDFHNLIDVYMDAVFYPSVRENRMTFDQEGWHYELTKPDGHVTYKGVVYNEMKGVFSSPEQTLFRNIQAELFPGHVYGFESGGDPMDIPKLSYETFVKFHETYYHPSNSYIFYYGDVDVEKELEWLDQAYLSNFEYKDVDSEIALMKGFEKPKHVDKSYPIATGESTDNKAYLSYNLMLGEGKDMLENVGFDILEYLLIDSEGAPLKAALLDAGLGEDIFSSYDGDIRQLTFSLIAKNAKAEDEERFVETIDSTLKKIAEAGFEHKKVEAALNRFEFRVKEADFGSYPKGVIYAMRVMETWLYDENPFMSFAYSDIFDELRNKVKKGFLEGLIKKYFFENQHKVFLRLLPDPTYNQLKEDKVQQELSDYEATLTQEERQKLYEYTLKLIEFQENPDSKEDMAKLPHLELTDLDRDPESFDYSERMFKDTKVLFHAANSSDIVYLKCAFNVDFLPVDKLPILSLLSRYLIKLSTESHHYSDLSEEIDGKTGGISTNISVYEHKESRRYYTPVLEITGKSFVNQFPVLLDLIREILTKTRFDEVKRMRELLNEIRSRLQMSMKSAGHATAIQRAQSYDSVAASYKERIRGLYFYDEICAWQERSDESIQELGLLMKKTLESIVSVDGLTIGITTSEEYESKVKDQIQGLIFSLPNLESSHVKQEIPLIETTNEGILTTGDVQYVALSTNFKDHGFEYSGSLRVLDTILSMDYLWNNVRVKGGAYGAFSGVSRNGMMYFASYRDPNLKETLETYKASGDYVENLDLEESELVKYIIGTISQLDRPISPSMENQKMLTRYFWEITEEDVKENRHEILDTTLEKLKEYREMYQKIFINDKICVLGNDKKIEENKDLFSVLKRFD